VVVAAGQSIIRAMDRLEQVVVLVVVAVLDI
jgi:hypothetical protein